MFLHFINFKFLIIFSPRIHIVCKTEDADINVDIIRSIKDKEKRNKTEEESKDEEKEIQEESEKEEVEKDIEVESEKEEEKN